jgi:hypothetical protein
VHSAPASTETTRCTSCGELDYTGETKRCGWRARDIRPQCLRDICSRCFKASEYGYCAEHETAAREESES